MAIPLLAFWAALATMQRYAGALFDANGIPPVPVRLNGTVRQVELNTVAVLLASIVLLIAVALYH